MTDIGKRLFCLVLSALLFITWEVPVLAGNLTELKGRMEEKREQERMEEEKAAWEKSVFAPKEGVTLSGSAVFTGMEDGTGSGMEEGDGTEEEAGTGNSGGAEIQDGQAAPFEAPLRQPEADGEEDLELLYGKPVETGRNYRTYKTPEGTYKTIFTSYANTYMENGEEKPIDNTLVSGNSAEGEAYTNKESDVAITFFAEDTGSAAISVSGNGVEALLKPLEGDYDKSAVSENAIRYNEVFENIDVQYAAEPNGVKQDIILLAPQERREFTYRLEKEGVIWSRRRNWRQKWSRQRKGKRLIMQRKRWTGILYTKPMTRTDSPRSGA